MGCSASSCPTEFAQHSDLLSICCRSRKRQIEVKKAIAEAQEAADKEFAAAWQKRLEQLKAEEVSLGASATNRSSRHVEHKGRLGLHKFCGGM